MKIGNKEFDCGEGRSFVMGILNITPDSFSDGGRFKTINDTMDCVEKMIKQGVDIIDVGGESTRPGYKRISDEEEIRRAVPVIKAIKQNFDIPVSIDTYKSHVAEMALGAGADMVNDIWGLKYDMKMAQVVAKHRKVICITHNNFQVPAITERKSFYNAIEKELQNSIKLAIKAGVDKNNIILDPGIGFAKTTDMNIWGITVLQRLSRFGFPLLLGISRKSLIGNILDLPVDEREEATITLNVIARMYGCHFFRVHSVVENVRALQMADAILRSEKSIRNRRNKKCTIKL